MFLFLVVLWVHGFSITYEVVGQTITISGSGVVTREGVCGAGAYASYTKAIVGEGITEIGGGAFRTCSKLKQVSLPSTLKILRTGCFGSTNITSLIIPASVEVIEDSILDCTPYCTTVVVEPESNHYYSENNVVYTADKTILIAAPSGITSLSILDTVITIQKNSLRWINIETVTLPDSVETVQEAVFYSSAVRTIHCGKNLMSFAISAIDLCVSLIEITVDSQNKNFYSTDDGVFGAMNSDGSPISIIFMKKRYRNVSY